MTREEVIKILTNGRFWDRIDVSACSRKDMADIHDAIDVAIGVLKEPERVHAHWVDMNEHDDCGNYRFTCSAC